MTDNNCYEDLESSSSSQFSNTESSNPPSESKVELLKKLHSSEEPFYFESDSLALRNNPDYSCLLKTMVLLEAQRVAACNDIETLIDLKEQALKDPSKFLKSLSHKRTGSANFTLFHLKLIAKTTAFTTCQLRLVSNSKVPLTLF